MKQLAQLLFKRVRGWYYYQELKELSTIAFYFLFGWFIYRYGEVILQLTFTEKGLTYLFALMLSVVSGLTIKLYYRIIVIKYYEKDVRIRLLENKAENRI